MSKLPVCLSGVTTKSEVVCKATWFTLSVLTPSRMSISPPAGQLFRLAVQKAGHDPHTLHVRYDDQRGMHALGMCEKSAMMRTSLKVSLDSNLTD